MSEPSRQAVTMRELAVRAFPHDPALHQDDCQHTCICGAEESRRRCEAALEAYRAALLRELAEEAVSFAWTKTGVQIAEWLRQKVGEK